MSAKKETGLQKGSSERRHLTH